MQIKTIHRESGKLISCFSALLVCVLAASTACAQNQDSAFMACANESDRGQRIACLEDALEAAVNAAQSAPAVAPAPAPPRASIARPAPTAPVQAEAPQQAEEDNKSFMDRIRSFGRKDKKADEMKMTGPNISTDEKGEDQLFDTITELEKRRDLWVVTLASGQVWGQKNTGRNFNLREGDQIKISRGGFGNGFRLETERLSGFIRVERIK